jgi:predicted DsbA family dithiol-disulfide isomerase
MEVAQSVGINGTPAFVLGKFDSEKGIIKGEILTGAQPIDVIEAAINRYLNK